MNAAGWLEETSEVSLEKYWQMLLPDSLLGAAEWFITWGPPEGPSCPPPTTEHVLFGSAVQCTTSAVYLGKDFIWGISYKVSHILFLCQFPWALCYFQLAHFYPHLHVNNDESERHLSKTENADAWGVGCHLKANNLFISFDHKPHLKVFCFAVTVSFWGFFFVFEMLITS